MCENRCCNCRKTEKQCQCPNFILYTCEDCKKADSAKYCFGCNAKVESNCRCIKVKDSDVIMRMCDACQKKNSLQKINHYRSLLGKLSKRAQIF